jgi:hypothetical protein
MSYLGAVLKRGHYVLNEVFYFLLMSYIGGHLQNWYPFVKEPIFDPFWSRFRQSIDKQQISLHNLQ